MIIEYKEGEKWAVVKVVFSEDDELTDENHSRWTKRINKFLSGLDWFYPAYRIDDIIYYFNGSVDKFDNEIFRDDCYVFVRECFHNQKED